jgi:PAS domain S-box-containing protein
MSTEPRHNGMEIALRLLDALEHSLEGPAEQPNPRSVEAVGATLHELRGALQGLARDRQVDDQKLREAHRQGEAQQRQLGILHSLLSHTKTQLAYLDPQMHFVEVNPTYVEGCGYSRKDLIGRNHFELFPNAENQAIFEHVVQTGEPVEYVAKPFEFPERPELGTTYWDWTLQPDLDAHGQVRGLVLSLLDVTERECARQEREQHLERHGRLLEVSQQVLQETTTQGLLQSVVDAATELTGARNGFAGHGYADGTFRVDATSRIEDAPPCPPGEEFTVRRGGVYLHILQTSKTMRLTQEELQAHSAWWGLPEGHAPLRGLLGVPLLDRSARSVGLIMLSDKREGQFTAEDEGLLAQLAAVASLGLQHISARDQAERHAAELEGAIAAIPDGLLIYDAQGQIVQANAEARAILRYSPTEAAASVSERLAAWHLQDEQGRPLRLQDFPLLRAMRGETVHDEVLRAQRPGDEGESWLAVSTAPVRDVEGNVVSVVGSLRDISEHERLLAQLEEQRARLHAVLDNAPEGIVVVDRQARVVLTNRAADELYGRHVPFGEHGLRHTGMMLCREDGTPYDPREMPLARSAVGGETVRGEEITIIWPDGRKRILLTSSSPICSEGGEITGAVGIFQDMTDLITTQRQLERTSRRLQRLRDMDQAVLSARSAQEIAQVGLAYLRELVRCTHASVALFEPHRQQMTILAAECDNPTHLNLDDKSLVTQKSYLDPLRAGKLRVTEDLSASGKLAEVAQQMLAATGMQSSAHVPLLVKGELIGSLNLGWGSPGRPSDEDLEIARGIADQVAIGIQQARLREQLRRHGEELEGRVARRTAALAASRARLQAIFVSAPTGIAVLDEAGSIVQSNDALCHILGYAADELQGLPFVSLAEAEGADEVATALIEAWSQPASHQRRRHRILRKDGQVRWVNITATQVRAEKQQASQLLVMVDDITEERQAQELLLRTEKLALTGRLAASVAHEINNPLQSVIGCLSLVEEAAAEDADFGQYLQVARDELRRAADIIARLRDVHRPGREEDKEPVPINELLERVLTLTQKQAADNNVQVSWAPAEDLPTVMALPDRLQQVFLNLVLNGIDATSGRGCLEVQTRSTDDPIGVQVIVHDNGPGIDAGMQASLFEPFQTTKPGGLGLGLYISRRIVENHGGRIEVSSELGKGSTFTVWLPA